MGKLNKNAFESAQENDKKRKQKMEAAFKNKEQYDKEKDLAEQKNKPKPKEECKDMREHNKNSENDLFSWISPVINFLCLFLTALSSSDIPLGFIILGIWMIISIVEVIFKVFNRIFNRKKIFNRSMIIFLVSQNLITLIISFIINWAFFPKVCWELKFWVSILISIVIAFVISYFFYFILRKNIMSLNRNAYIGSKNFLKFFRVMFKKLYRVFSVFFLINIVVTVLIARFYFSPYIIPHIKNAVNKSVYVAEEIILQRNLLAPLSPNGDNGEFIIKYENELVKYIGPYTDCEPFSTNEKPGKIYKYGEEEPFYIGAFQFGRRVTLGKVIWSGNINIFFQANNGDAHETLGGQYSVAGEIESCEFKEDVLLYGNLTFNENQYNYKSYIGNFDEDERFSGSGTFTWTDGSTAIGTFDNGKFKDGILEIVKAANVFGEKHKEIDYDHACTKFTIEYKDYKPINNATKTFDMSKYLSEKVYHYVKFTGNVEDGNFVGEGSIELNYNNDKIIKIYINFDEDFDDNLWLIKTKSFPAEDSEYEKLEIKFGNKNEILDVTIKFKDDSNQKQYTGTVYNNNTDKFKKGKLEYGDSSKYESFDGDFYENGNFKSGKLKFKEQNDYGFDTYEGSFKSEPDGDNLDFCFNEGTLTYSNKNIYNGSFLDNKRSEQGKLTFYDDNEYRLEYYDGKWLKDKPHDKSDEATLKWKNGDTYKGHFENGVFNGTGKRTFNKFAGKINTALKEIYLNGAWSNGTFKKGTWYIPLSMNNITKNREIWYWIKIDAKWYWINNGEPKDFEGIQGQVVDLNGDTQYYPNGNQITVDISEDMKKYSYWGITVDEKEIIDWWNK